MADFQYAEPFPQDGDDTPYRRLTEDHVSLTRLDGLDILKVAPEALTLLAREAFREIAFFYRARHLKQVAAILEDREASPNDRGVALALLRNAEIAAQGQLPMCQDTGTATIVAKKGQRVFTGVRDEEYLARGVYETYTSENLRYSQTVALSMYEEKNSGTNLPAQIDIYATDGDHYDFLFVAKGGGSANKSLLFQETKALLNPKSLETFMAEKMRSLGTAACPPYHLVFVVGGTSAEACLKTVKLASTGYLDHLPTSGGPLGQAFRDPELEEKALRMARETGIGAQFGGKYFALDVRVIRLPRHGASCPVGVGVSCSADRNAKARIDRDGIWIEQLEHDPARFIPEKYRRGTHRHGVTIDLNRPMKEILAELTKHPVSTPLLLSGPIVVARDIAHAKLKERLDRGEDLPQYVKEHPVYYAGPAKTPRGLPSGSFGPTTAGRMDSYVDLFQSRGGSMVMIAKGNRSKQVTEACRKHGGFYLGSIGGPAALLAKESIRKVELLEYAELGMEAIYKIDVVEFPAFILVDDKGNDFFMKVSLPVATAWERTRSLRYSRSRRPQPVRSAAGPCLILQTASEVRAGGAARAMDPPARRRNIVTGARQATLERARPRTVGVPGVVDPRPRRGSSDTWGQEDPMSTMEVGQKLVALCKEGKNLEALDTLYSKDAESIEAMAMPEIPAEMKGLDALKKKNEWWFANNQLHGGDVKGPFPNGDRFAVVFSFDVTPKAGPMAGQRMQMEEVALYTVKGGKIVREEFFYTAG